MSTYSTTEAALLQTLQDYGFDDLSSSRGDFSILNNKGVARAVVLMQARPSEFAFDLGGGRASHGKRQQRHVIACVIFQARGQNNDGVSYVALTELTDALIAYLDKYPLLGAAANVKRADVGEATEPRIRRDKAWIYQTVFVSVDTETTIEAVEFIR